MVYVLGIVIFALGILISVSLHEAGHMGTAKLFGMKVTRFFVGFGPTLFSFRRGETEYGLKAIPAGGFCKISGMTPLDEDDIGPGDEKRVFWRKPLWQRTIVLAAGSVTHFILGFLLLWVTAAFVGLPNQAGAPGARAEIGGIANCVIADYEVTDGKVRSECAAGDPQSPAAAAGLRTGDVITAVDGKKVSNWDELVQTIRPARGEISVTYKRGGDTRTTTMSLVATERPKINPDTGGLLVDPNTGIAKPEDLETVSAIGVLNQPEITFGPVESIGVAGNYTGQIFTGTFTAIKKFPEKVPKLISALTGEERDPETPISVVGASVLGGEAVRAGVWPFFFFLLASLNIFIGIFNLVPLLPLDGGHIAIAWFEKVRSWWAARRGKPDPGRVDYNKLIPVTYAFILVFGSISVLTIATDIVNPISLFAP